MSALARIRQVPLPKETYRVALRPDEDGVLDDVFVRDVEMFRLERMDRNAWWLCCYLAGHERIDFWAHWTRKDGLVFSVTDLPNMDVSYEPGSIEP